MKKKLKKFHINLVPYKSTLNSVSDGELIQIEEGESIAASKYHALTMFLHREEGEYKNDALVLYYDIIPNIDDYVTEIGETEGIKEMPIDKETKMYMIAMVRTNERIQDYKNVGKKVERKNIFYRCLKEAKNLPDSYLEQQFLRWYNPDGSPKRTIPEQRKLI
jgi:hypothetical protein